MHEISLLQNLCEILQQQAEQQHFSQVKKITLEVGTLSCIEIDALRFGFDVVMQGSLAKHAELGITEVSGIGICQQCARHISIQTYADPCHVCGHPCVQVIKGNEMKIKDLLVI